MYKHPESKPLFALTLIALALAPHLAFGHGGAHDPVAAHQQADAELAAAARLRDLWRLPLALTETLEEWLLRTMGTAQAATGSPALYGEWSPAVTWPFAFASAATLPDGRILAWGGNNLRSFDGGTFTYAAVWDPLTNRITNFNHGSHSMFCGMPVMLEDGRVFVAGGDTGNASSVKGTSTFNFRTNAWTRIQDLAVGRWYNGSVALPNGKVFAALGEGGSAYPELWTEGQGWTYLNGASLQQAVLDYPTVTEPRNWLPHLHLGPNGKIFHSGHTPQMHWIDPTGNGSVAPVNLTNTWNTANTPSVLFAEGKVLQVGGALYSNNAATGQAAVIDFNSDVPTKNVIGSMQFSRIFHNQVVLPNGEVMVIGGNSSGEKFSDNGSRFTPEIWNPATQAWRQAADQQVPRNYHSVALLMTDGRVWSGGGGLCNCSADHPDAQVFSPPYLFNPDGSPAIRPEIGSAPTVVSYGRTINVAATPGIARFSLIRMASTTHAIDSDTRFLSVPFTQTSPGQYELTLHTNRNVMTPGYWMLFALNGQGVPSIAKVMQVSTSFAPVINNPGDQASALNADAVVTIDASDPNGDLLTFSATGLPQGLRIDPTTGIIAGRPAQIGSSRVVVSVTDGTNTVSSSFVWTVADATTAFRSAIAGGAGGTAFTDAVAANQRLTGITVRSGWWLDSIQGILNTGALPLHGGAGGGVNNVSWPADEYLVRMYGKYGTYVGQISFVTNTGRVFGPYGTGQGGMDAATFDISVPSGSEIVGFHGRASGYLDAIGAIYRLRQTGNQPPLVAALGNQLTEAGAAVSLDITASDPDGDAISFAATGLPPGLTMDSATGRISGRPSATGDFNVLVTVRDSRGGSSALNFTWTVNVVPLVINPVTTRPMPLGTDVTLTANTSNGVNVRYKWSFGDGTPETAYSSTAQVVHRFTQSGLYVVRVTVIDDRNVTATTTFIQAIHRPVAAGKPSQSANLAYASTAVGERLWVVNPDNDSVTVFNAATNSKILEIAVGNAPRSIAVAPDGRIWVTNQGSASISIISPTGLGVVQTVALPYASKPYGLAFAADGSAGYVVLAGQGRLLKLNAATGATLGTVDVGANPRHLSVSQDGSRILVSRFITPALPGEGTALVQTQVNGQNVGGEVVSIDAASLTVTGNVVLQHSDKEDTENKGAGIPNYLAAATIAPDGLTAWVPSKQDNVKRGSLRNGLGLTFQNSVRAISSQINLATLRENYAARLDHDNSGLGSAAVFDQSGNYLFVALETSREVAIIDAYGGRELGRIAVGRAPEGLAISADGAKLYVSNFMDRSICVVDLSKVLDRGDWNPPVIATLASVATDRLPAQVLAGKQFFYDAKDPRLALDGYLSCASCHNEAEHDGRTWDFTGFGEGLRNTPSLKGRAGMGQGFVHWSANFDEIQDFEGQIRNFAGGTGLMTAAQLGTGTRAQPLGDRKTGVSADLDALAAYLNSLNRFDNTPFRATDGTLTSAAIAGKTVFEANNCGTCHTGPGFTGSGDATALKNIGTIKPTSGKRLNGTLTGIDVPTLRDVWATGPYLHDGSAPTLAAAVQAHQGNTVGGTDLENLVAYLRQIGNEEAGPGAGTGPSNGTGTGLTANYFANATLTGTPALTRVEAPWFDWGVGAPAANIPGDNFSVRWNGDVQAIETGAYQFRTNSDDGVRVWVNGALIIDNWTVHAPTVDTSGVVTLGAGQRVSIVVEFQEFGGGALLQLSWLRPGAAWAQVPVAQLYPAVVPPPANVPPTVALTAPANNASVVQGTAIPVSANAADSDGTVARVEFYDGATLIGSDATAPYSLSWTNAAVGAHSVTAKAFDNAGASTTSAAVAVTVTSSTGAGTGTGTGLTANYFANATLTGTPALTRVEVPWFDWGVGVPAANIPGDNFSVRWTGDVQAIETGAYQFRTNSDDGVRVWVNGALIIDNWTVHAPTVDTSGVVTLGAGQRVSIVVEFQEFGGGALLQLSWLRPGAGWAQVPVAQLYPAVVPPPSNVPPTVALTAPANNASVAQGTAITVSANAADSDGTVARVEFYDGATLIGSDATAPYSLSWTNAAAGAHSVTARAFDNVGAVTTSSAVALTVTAVTTNTPPANAVACASEGGTCTLPAGSTASVWYGANTGWAARTGVTGSIGCNNTVFGDPLPGIVKSCRYVVTSTGTGTGTGLTARYFANATLASTPTLTRVEAPWFDWGTGAPAASLPADNFSVRWSGQVQAIEAGNYQFRTNSDDGVRVWVNGVLVIDNWTAHPPTVDTSGLVTLAAGQRVAIVVEFQEFGGGAVLQLGWLRPGGAWAQVPTAQLYP